MGLTDLAFTGGVFRWQAFDRGRMFAGSSHLRQFMPLPRPTRFRLLADLPLEVAFKTVTYRPEIAQVPVSGMWRLKG